MFVQHYSEKGPTEPQAGNDAATKTSLVSYCFHSSIIPQEYESGNDATIKINQDGDDAASRPTRRRIKMATMPQVVLLDNELSRQ
jgi:hypothetical protein